MVVTMTTPDKCSICGRWPATLRPAMRRAVLSIPRHGACEDFHDAFAANLVAICKVRQEAAVGQGPSSAQPHHAGRQAQQVLPIAHESQQPVRQRPAPRLTMENVFAALCVGYFGLLVYLYFFPPP
jgi:hypothetical protein